MNSCVAISQHWHQNDMDYVASSNMCSVTHFVCVAGLIYVTGLIHVLLSASAGIETAVSMSRPVIRVVRLELECDTAVTMSRSYTTCGVTRFRVWHGSFMGATWLIDVRDVTRLIPWYLDGCADVTSSNICDMTHYCVRHDSFVCITWLVYKCVCDMTHSCAWCSYWCARCDSFIYWYWNGCADTAVCNTCGLTHLCVWHDSLCVTRLRCVRGMTHGCAWSTHWCARCDSFIHWNGCADVASCNTYGMTHCVCDMTHVCAWQDSFMCVTWLIYILRMAELKKNKNKIIDVRDLADLLTDIKTAVHMLRRIYVWKDSFVCGKRYICARGITLCGVRHDSWMCEASSRLLCVWCETWLVCVVWDMTRECVRHPAGICVWGMTQLFGLNQSCVCVWHDLLMCEAVDIALHVPYIYMSISIYIYVCIYICVYTCI